MIKVFDSDLERGTTLAIDRIEIVTDEIAPDRVEIYILDSNNQRQEGGSFDLSQFMDWILRFYLTNK